MFRARTIAAVVLGAGALAATAGPAFAAGTPVAVQATVNQTITVTGPPPSLNLAGDPGTTATGGISYTVTTNDGAGYTTTVRPQAMGLGSSHGNIDNANMGYSANGGAETRFNGGNPLTVADTGTVSGASGDTYNDQFRLHIPGNAPADTYAETFVYLTSAK